MERDLLKAKAIKKGPGETRQCPVCGKDYHASFSNLSRGKDKFCSSVCGFRGRPRPEWTGANNPAWKGEGKQSSADKSKKYRRDNPDKCCAHRVVRYALKKGRLDKLPCEVCGSTVMVHAHHEDYSKPLDVKWLCNWHHAVAHGATTK
jgi:hypothetical protein